MTWVVPGTQSGQPSYRITDHLGSLNYTLDPSGNILGSSNVYPYGQSAGNTTGDSFIFTDHERDSENNTDATLFRHYASAQGRWLSPDPSIASYDLSDPQSFNRYAYVDNRPVTHSDALGLDWNDGTFSAGGGDDDGGGGGGSDAGSDGGWSIEISFSGIVDFFEGLFGGGDGESPQYVIDPQHSLSLTTQPSGPPSGAGGSYFALAYNGSTTGSATGSWITRDFSPGNGLDASGLAIVAMSPAQQPNKEVSTVYNETSGLRSIPGQSTDANLHDARKSTAHAYENGGNFQSIDHLSSGELTATKTYDPAK